MANRYRSNRAMEPLLAGKSMCKPMTQRVTFNLSEGNVLGDVGESHLRRGACATLERRNKEEEVLIAVDEVESVDHWKTQFKTHVDVFRNQGVSIVHMGASNDNKVIAIFDTNDQDEFIRIFNDPVTAEAMADDKVTGGVEMFLIDESFTI